MTKIGVLNVMHLIGNQATNVRKGNSIYVRHKAIVTWRQVTYPHLTQESKYLNDDSNRCGKYSHPNTPPTLSVVAMMSISQPQTLKVFGYIKKQE
jgi:hypothetical protein